MAFEYEDEKVVDQWIEMSRRSQDGDELMVDVLWFERAIIPTAHPCRNFQNARRDEDSNAPSIATVMQSRCSRGVSTEPVGRHRRNHIVDPCFVAADRFEFRS
jgi:hypothetical protein